MYTLKIGIMLLAYDKQSRRTNHAFPPSLPSPLTVLPAPPPLKETSGKVVWTYILIKVTNQRFEKGGTNIRLNVNRDKKWVKKGRGFILF